MDDDDEVEEVGDLCLHLILLLIRSVKGLAHRSRAINQNNFISIVNKDKHPLPLFIHLWCGVLCHLSRTSR